MFYAHKTCWKNKSIRKETPWGYELIWATLRGVHGKLIFINKGHSTSLKYFERKDEVIYIRSGKVKVIWGDSSITKEDYPSNFSQDLLGAGRSFCIQSGCPYKIIALEDSEIIEIGSSSDSDLVRMQDDYGRETHV